MSEMVPEQQGGGGSFMTMRPLGIPVLVWVAGAAILAYFIFFRGKGGAGGTSTGGGGTITTGDTTIDTGAVQVSVTQKGPVTSDTDTTTTTTNEDQDQPTPNPPPRQHHGKGVKIPQVAGKTAAEAISDLESVGLEVTTNPLRNPKDEYVATGTVPPAGATVPEHTRVTLRVRVSKTGRTPAPKRQPVPRRQPVPHRRPPVGRPPGK